MWVDVRMAEQENVVFRLHYDLTPQMEGKLHFCATEDVDNVVLQSLDYLLCYVVLMVV